MDESAHPTVFFSGRKLRLVLVGYVDEQRLEKKFWGRVERHKNTFYVKFLRDADQSGNTLVSNEFFSRDNFKYAFWIEHVIEEINSASPEVREHMALATLKSTISTPP
ncbi:hypothetical protein LTR84_004813 [Exophiala bonariae]|uniref:Uncharacterized protein n=1 Tax=Exophiala bonariae TaxID=1690606 RepID=A0AAV9NN89_9EURO|nr:hypothetical protein LTR84_004813 [Exophiala bonariae]